MEGLQSPGVSWTEEQRADLLGTARTSLDRLTSLVENLLDMSRLQAGALSVFPRAVAIEDVVAHTVREFDADGIHVGLDVPDDLPEVTADPPLLERVLANLVSNAVRFSPPGMPPTVTANADGDRVLVRVIDHGPGVPAEHREEILSPSQRRGDTDNTTGLGLAGRCAGADGRDGRHVDDGGDCGRRADHGGVVGCVTGGGGCRASGLARAGWDRRLRARGWAGRAGWRVW